MQAKIKALLKTVEQEPNAPIAIQKLLTGYSEILLPYLTKDDLTGAQEVVREFTSQAVQFGTAVMTNTAHTQGRGSAA